MPWVCVAVIMQRQVPVEVVKVIPQERVLHRGTARGFPVPPIMANVEVIQLVPPWSGV